MKVTEIVKNIYSVGVSDWNVRNFHGYLTQRGSSYNSYLIIDDKIALIDTVKAPFTKEFIDRISLIVPLDKIDYVVSNHVEMDHSGAMPEIMKRCPNAVVLTSQSGEKEHKLHYDTSKWNVRVVQSGDSVSLGKRTLSFLMTPMVHWPDNMVTYCPEDKILFSNDAFGQHYASAEYYDDELPLDLILWEAKKYYANIVMPYSNQVVAALEAASKLDIKMIAPSHGLIWRSHIDKIFAAYNDWSHAKSSKKAVIVYDSMYGSTEKIAYAIRDAFESKGYDYKFFDLKSNHHSDVITDCLDAEYICVGSPTLNKNIMPSVASMLTYIQGLIVKGKKGILFGSYGWAPQNIKVMQRYFDESGIDLVASYNNNFIPNAEYLKSVTKDLETRI
ncbi:MAG: FprA family A-type flavoprotein [Bacteroidales bacterium]|jgi:flavorubredoxin|nr:FprA family A-type flavoprotein [Bacteroidales bacterium]